MATAEDPQKCENFYGEVAITVWKKKSPKELEILRGKDKLMHPLYGTVHEPERAKEPEGEFASNAPN